MTRNITAQLPAKDEPAQWCAFRTRHKREKRIAQRLNALGIRCYIPLKQVVRKYASKTKTLQIPLVSSYAFIKLKAQDYATVLADDDIYEIVHFQGVLGKIKEEEISFLQNVLRDGGLEYNPQLVEDFSEGTPVRIAGGTLAGTEGKVVERHGKHEFLVDISALGVSIKLIVRKSELAPLQLF